jgi:hypothetical protein
MDVYYQLARRRASEALLEAVQEPTSMKVIQTFLREEFFPVTDTRQICHFLFGEGILSHLIYYVDNYKEIPFNNS